MAQAEKAISVEEKPIEFFGDVDKQPNGRIRSQYPAWYFDRAKEDLEETVASKERKLASGILDAADTIKVRTSLKQDKSRLTEINKSRPKLTGQAKDKLNNIRSELGEEISNSMFTHTDMDFGYASANEEADRMVKPCVKLSPKMAEIAQGMGINLSRDRKVSRNQATKMWQIVSKAIGENTNAEILRKEGTTSRRHIMR